LFENSPFIQDSSARPIGSVRRLLCLPDGREATGRHTADSSENLILFEKSPMVHARCHSIESHGLRMSSLFRRLNAYDLPAMRNEVTGPGKSLRPQMPEGTSRGEAR